MLRSDCAPAFSTTTFLVDAYGVLPLSLIHYTRLIVGMVPVSIANSGNGSGFDS